MKSNEEHFRVGREPPEAGTLVDRVNSALQSVVPRSLERRLDPDGSNPWLEAVPTGRSGVDVEAAESDEDVVYRFLDENDGRVKQATIARRTDWSEAKVSRLLSSMEEAGRIERYRIGREKVVQHPGQ
jgi:hypothetical protein